MRRQRCGCPVRRGRRLLCLSPLRGRRPWTTPPPSWQVRFFKGCFLGRVVQMHVLRRLSGSVAVVLCRFEPPPQLVLP